jgi:hypothetical protein
MKAAGVPPSNISIDKQSGKDFNHVEQADSSLLACLGLAGALLILLSCSRSSGSAVGSCVFSNYVSHIKYATHDAATGLSTTKL